MVVQYFWCDEIRRSTNISWSGLFVIHCQSKITKFGNTSLIKKDVSKFQIAMNNPFAVNILKGLRYFFHYVGCLRLRDLAMLFEQGGQTLPFAQLKHKTDFYLIFKMINQLDNMGMVQTFLNLNFGVDFIALGWFGYSCFWNNFQCNFRIRTAVRFTTSAFINLTYSDQLRVSKLGSQM